MILSVINDTSLCRQEVQTTIPAVDRHLQEDFRPYWHVDAQLRLEGRTEETLDPNRTLNMRGDGVIYLTEEYDAARALGYHERNLRGLPCGFVSTGLSQMLEEEWSVTLSHEALEMALDPEFNRLVQGPHPDPDEARRLVYHWYEVCGAGATSVSSIRRRGATIRTMRPTILERPTAWTRKYVWAMPSARAAAPPTRQQTC